VQIKKPEHCARAQQGVTNNLSASFLVQCVFSAFRAILLQLQPVRSVLPVFLGNIVSGLAHGALKNYYLALRFAFFRHNSRPDRV